MQTMVCIYELQITLFVVIRYNLLLREQEAQYLKPRPTSKMTSRVQVHVVSKTNCSDAHIVGSDPSLLPPLAPNNIRLQVRMASLTSNNLTYARLASVANWWDGELHRVTPI
jgi:hypothetical protein